MKLGKKTFPRTCTEFLTQQQAIMLLVIVPIKSITMRHIIESLIYFTASFSIKWSAYGEVEIPPLSFPAMPIMIKALMLLFLSFCHVPATPDICSQRRGGENVIQMSEKVPLTKHAMQNKNTSARILLSHMYCLSVVRFPGCAACWKHWEPEPLVLFVCKCVMD